MRRAAVPDLTQASKLIQVAIQRSGGECRRT